MYVQTVEELMTGVASVDFVQPWYRCVSTSLLDTGMALGGIGTAITSTPAGTTPVFHFFNGCGIENSTGRTIELDNYFYGECISDDLVLKVRSPSFFSEDIIAYPLFDDKGEKYFSGGESEQQAEKILTKIINTKSFVDDNYGNLKRWGFLDQELNGTLYHSSEHKDYRYRNFSFLLNIFSYSVSRNILYTRSLIGDVCDTHRLYKECYPSDRMLYEFQYPLSITHYKEETQRCIVKKVHITPMCPGNDILCSLPLFTTGMHVTNPTNQSMDVTFVLSVENFIGYELVKSRTGTQDALFHIQRSFKGQKAESYSENIEGRRLSGLTFRQNSNCRKGDIRGELNIAVVTDNNDNILVSTKANYYLDSESNAVDSGIAAGKVWDMHDDAVSTTAKEPICGAICVSLRLSPGESKEFEVLTVMDFPNIEIGNYSSEKKYTEYFPREEYRSRDIANYFFRNRRNIYLSEWAMRRTFQNAYLSANGVIDPTVQGRLRQMSIDNLAFIAESSVWDKSNRFLVRECVDYPFFNSLDVYFYGSFGLLKLLPNIDNRIIRDFNKSVLSEDCSEKLFGPYVRFKDENISPNLFMARKVMGSTPHDLGTPFDEKANAYSWKNVVLWVDLAPKYVLLVYRNFLFTRDHSLLDDCWEGVEVALEYIKSNFVENESYLPISSGYANTFDNLRGDGVCIYPASLWVAGLTAAAEIAKILKKKDRIEYYREYSGKARQQLIDMLWDDRSGVYLYSVSPLQLKHLKIDIYNSLSKESRQTLISLLEHVGYKSAALPEPGKCVALFNKFINADELTIPEYFIDKVKVTSELSEINGIEIQDVLDVSKMKSREIKKVLLHRLLPEIFIDGYENNITGSECDHIFANQLCADTYLYYLDLQEITSRSNKIRILSNIASKNIGGCERRIGAPNMVSRSGEDLDAFQAQDVWLGVQYGLAGAFASVGMFAEFEELIDKVFDAVYKAAKIPFGVPEGFNCVGIFIAEDLIRLGVEDEDVRSGVIETLYKMNVLKPGNKVNFELLESLDDMEEFDLIWSTDRNKYAEEVCSDELYDLLMATKLKYTAGRYFRAGMIHMLSDIIDKYFSGEPCVNSEDEVWSAKVVDSLESEYAPYAEIMSDAR